MTSSSRQCQLASCLQEEAVIETAMNLLLLFVGCSPYPGDGLAQISVRAATLS